MDRNSLSTAEEDDFLEAVRCSIRIEGRDRVLDAFFVEEISSPVNLEENFDNSCDSDDSDLEEHSEGGDSCAEDVDDDVHSVDGNPDVSVKLHDPILHDNVHCPPFYDVSNTFCGVPCDCEDFCFASCFQEDNFQFFKDCYYSIDFDAQLTLAIEGVNNIHRRPNNEMRKYFYKNVFFSIDFGVVEKGERRRLPNCAVAKIRQILYNKPYGVI